MGAIGFPFSGNSNLEGDGHIDPTYYSDGFEVDHAPVAMFEPRWATRLGHQPQAPVSTAYATRLSPLPLDSAMILVPDACSNSLVETSTLVDTSYPVNTAPPFLGFRDWNAFPELLMEQCHQPVANYRHIRPHEQIVPAFLPPGSWQAPIDISSESHVEWDLAHLEPVQNPPPPSPQHRPATESRPRKEPKTEAEWERHREEIEALYPRKMAKEIRKMLEDKHSFVVT